MRVDWSHLSMKAYEYFLLCNLCGAMIHDSPTSKHQHEVWHTIVAGGAVTTGELYGDVLVMRHFDEGAPECR